MGGISGVSMLPGASAVGAVGTDRLLLSSWGSSTPQKTSLSVKGKVESYLSS